MYLNLDLLHVPSKTALENSAYLTSYMAVVSGSAAHSQAKRVHTSDQFLLQGTCKCNVGEHLWVLLNASGNYFPAMINKSLGTPKCIGKDFV